MEYIIKIVRISYVRDHRFCAPDNLFKVILCVCYFYTRCLLNITTDSNDMAPDRMKEQSTKDSVFRVMSSKYIT